MDWDRMMAHKARGNGFVGRGMRDEDAYFAAFAGEPEEIVPAHWITRLSRITLWVKRAIVVR